MSDGGPPNHLTDGSTELVSRTDARWASLCHSKLWKRREPARTRSFGPFAPLHSSTAEPPRIPAVTSHTTAPSRRTLASLSLHLFLAIPRSRSLSPRAPSVGFQQGGTSAIPGRVPRPLNRWSGKNLDGSGPLAFFFLASRALWLFARGRSPLAGALGACPVPVLCLSCSLAPLCGAQQRQCLRCPPSWHAAAGSVSCVASAARFSRPPALSGVPSGVPSHFICDRSPPDVLVWLFCCSSISPPWSSAHRTQPRHDGTGIDRHPQEETLDRRTPTAPRPIDRTNLSRNLPSPVVWGSTAASPRSPQPAVRSRCPPSARAVQIEPCLIGAATYTHARNPGAQANLNLTLAFSLDSASLGSSIDSNTRPASTAPSSGSCPGPRGTSGQRFPGQAVSVLVSSRRTCHPPGTNHPRQSRHLQSGAPYLAACAPSSHEQHEQRSSSHGPRRHTRRHPLPPSVPPSFLLFNLPTAACPDIPTVSKATPELSPASRGATLRPPSALSTRRTPTPSHSTYPHRSTPHADADAAFTMFGTQHYSDVTRKRGRDDDDDLHNGPLSFGEHRNKRLQCLPLRTSPTSSKRWSAPMMPLSSVPCTLTPGDSDSEEQPGSRFSPWSSSPAPMSCQPSPWGPAESDRDMDMMDTMSPPPVPQHQHIHADQQAPSNGRMPTPIQPNFAAQVRGGAWGGPGPAVSHLNGVVNMGHMHAGFGADQSRCIPRTMEGADDWHAVQNRRLPSPISEGEDSSSHAGSGSLSPPGMILDNGFPSTLTMRLEQSSLDGHGHDDMGMMDVEDHHHMMSDDPVTTTIDSAPTETTSAPATPSPGRKGHIRSRHTVNTWTWQPGMKKSFSIGYRADCEKCRLKVPGHFNHIIVS